MSATITIDEAQAKLKELIHQLAPGEEVIITENQQPVAKLVGEPPKPRPGVAASRPGQGYHHHRSAMTHPSMTSRNICSESLLDTHTVLVDEGRPAIQRPGWT